VALLAFSLLIMCICNGKSLLQSRRDVITTQLAQVASVVSVVNIMGIRCLNAFVKILSGSGLSNGCG
jgi:hypothetical protein